MQSQCAFLPGYVNCYVTAEGKVFNGGKEKTPISKKGAAPQIRLQENNRTLTYGLATLVATHFVPNPNGYKKLMFIDGNNRNCHASNLRWITGKEFTYASLFKGKPPGEAQNRLRAKEEQKQKKKEATANRRQQKKQEAKQKQMTSSLPSDSSALPIPGYPGYFATACGEVWKGNRKLIPQQYRNKASRVKVKGEGSPLKRQTVARLIALTFLPNPEEHTRIIFLDRNKHNPSSANLKWVSEFTYRSWYRTEGCELLGEPKRKRKILSTPVTRHPATQPLSGYQGYFISPEGMVYKGDRLVSLIRRKGKSLKVKLCIPNTLPAAYQTLGVATLVARHFIPNPKQHLYIIFKDRNNHNCCKDNIAWVDGETFMWYCGVTQKAQGRKKMVMDREAAVQTTQHPLLKQFYKTEDEYWLEETWKEVENKLSGMLWDWKELRSDCYLYFSDRARRFSIQRDPTGLLLCYIRGIRSRLKAEVSDRLPILKLLTTDESLRNIHDYDEWD